MKKGEFRLFVFALIVALAVAEFLCVSNAKAEYPERPINMIVAFTAGGSMDIAIRSISAPAENTWASRSSLKIEVAVGRDRGGGGRSKCEA